MAVKIKINTNPAEAESSSIKIKINKRVEYIKLKASKTLDGNIIIADQPENYLDEVIKKKLFFLLESLNKLGATIIMTSNNHNMLTSTYKIINLGDGKW